MSHVKAGKIDRRDFMKKAGCAITVASLLSYGNRTAGAGDREPSGGMARTLLGDINPEELGLTLVHIHLTVDWSELYMPGVFGPIDEATHDEIVTRISDALNDYRDKYLKPYGFKGTVVDCTPVRVGRFPKLYRDIAQRSKIHILTMTGFWGETWMPMHIECARLYLQPNGVEKLAEFFIKEIREGMEDPHYPFGTRFTDIKAGIMKASTSQYMTPLERANHQGIALACIETGCPITTHTSDGGGMEEMELFLSMGVKPDRIAIGHLGHMDDRVNEVAYDYITKIADHGCYVEFDRHDAPYSIEKYVKLVTHLKKRGHIERILFGFDRLPYSYKGRNNPVKTPADWTANEAGFDFPYVLREICPALLEAGITEDEIGTMLVDNPKRYLAF